MVPPLSSSRQYLCLLGHSVHRCRLPSHGAERDWHRGSLWAAEGGGAGHRLCGSGAREAARSSTVGGGGDKSLMKGALWADPRAGLQNREGAGKRSPALHGENLRTDTGAQPSAARMVALRMCPWTQQQTSCLSFGDWKKKMCYVQWQKSPLCAFLKHWENY